MSNYFRWNAGRKRQGTPTLESQPGAHTGATRKYIPGYSSSNIVYLDTAAGNDAWTGANPTNSPAGTGPFLTYAAAATAASTTKKIRLVNSATLTSNITKPTEATIGTTSTIASASMTAPISSLTASTTMPWTGTPVHVTWSPKLKKWFGVSAADIASSPDGITWTIVNTFSGYSGRRIFWDENSQRIYVLCSSGNLLYSTDGTTYTTVTIGSSDLYAFTYSTSAEVYVVAGSDISKSWFSTDGITWQVATLNASNGILKAVTAFDSIFLFSSDGEQFKSENGATWTRTAPFGAYEVRAAAYMDNVSLLIVGDVDGAIYSSPDGVTWTVRRAGFGAEVFDMTYVPELEYLVLTDSGRILTRTTNGTAYTSTAALAAYAAGEQIYGVSYSPLFGQIITVGGNIGTSSDKAAFGPSYATTISAPVAGFSIQSVQYSGTVTAYNCTLKQPGTTAALSLDACRVTESGAHVSNNAVTAIGTLVEGDIHYTGVYAAANALDLNLNTIDGTLYIYNGSTTNYERIRDNIIENGVRTSYPVTVTSGNTRGTSSDGTIFGQFCTTSDPLFVDETDYKLQRVLDGYQYDSPMVAASQYYYNQATTQTFRDNGAWSYNEGSATYKYQRTFDFLMPATAIGSAIDFVRHNRANLHVAEDGTPDAVNTPDSRWEEIVMQFKTLPADHIDFINWLEGQVDMTCDISLSPSLTPTTAVTASGATAAGEAVITITDNSGLDSGDQLTIDGNTYTVLYTYGTTKVVLDRITTTALSDTESITVKYDTGFGEYQYVPMLERRLSRWYETDENYMRGLQIRFARKLP